MTRRVGAFLLVALLLAGVVSNFASSSPDGPDSAGVVGVLVTFGVGAGVFWLVRRRRAPADQQTSAGT